MMKKIPRTFTYPPALKKERVREEKEYIKLFHVEVCGETKKELRDTK
jgi:hypothetical protein